MDDKTKGRLRVLAVVLSFVATAVLAIVIGLKIGPGSIQADLVLPIKSAAPGPDGQKVWMERLSRDRHALFYAPAVAVVPPALSVDQRYDVTVELDGPTVVGIANPAAAIASRVLVGGSVGVSLHCFPRELSCTAITPERQEVNPGGGLVTWEWSIEAMSPGAAQIFATVTTYDQATSVALYVNKPRAINLSVASTWPYRLEHLAAWLDWLITLVGFGAVVAVVRWLWQRRPKRKPDEPAEKDAKPEAPAEA